MNAPDPHLGQRAAPAPASELAAEEGSSSPPRGPAGTGLGADIARIVFSSNQDPRQVLRLRRYFAAAGTSLLAIGFLFTCQAQGIISEGAVFEISAAILFAIVIFYVVLRSGLNLKLPDPSLTVPQMLTATVVVLYAIYAADRGRGVFVILLLMAFLFGVLHLKARALLLYAAFILVGYGAVLVLLWRFKPETL